MKRKEYTTFCHICPNHCAFKVIVCEDKILDVRAAGESRFPVHMCSVQKGAEHLIGTVESKDRLTRLANGRVSVEKANGLRSVGMKLSIRSPKS